MSGVLPAALATVSGVWLWSAVGPCDSGRGRDVAWCRVCGVTGSGPAPRGGGVPVGHRCQRGAPEAVRARHPDVWSGTRRRLDPRHPIRAETPWEARWSAIQSSQLVAAVAWPARLRSGSAVPVPTGSWYSSTSCIAVKGPWDQRRIHAAGNRFGRFPERRLNVQITSLWQPEHLDDDVQVRLYWTPSTERRASPGRH